MEATITKPPEEEAASRLLYHCWRGRFDEKQEAFSFPGITEGMSEKVLKDTEQPVNTFQIDLPLITGQWPLVFEEFVDGWVVYFKDFPSIIADSDGGNMEDALDNLAEVVLDDFQIMEEYKNNVSLHLKKRHKFLKKVFKT